MVTDPITRLNVALEGRNSVERKIGEGGMATVYLADGGPTQGLTWGKLGSAPTSEFASWFLQYC